MLISLYNLSDAELNTPNKFFYKLKGNGNKKSSGNLLCVF